MQLESVIGWLESIFPIDALLCPLYGIVPELDDHSTAKADQMIVMCVPECVLITRSPVILAGLPCETSIRQEFDRAKDRSLTDIGIDLLGRVHELLGRDVMLKGYESLKHGLALFSHSQPMIAQVFLEDLPLGH